MPINHQNKYIFIHIPKTGGTSIENFLDLCNPSNHFADEIWFFQKGVKYNYQHLTAFIYKTYGFLKPEDFETYFKFTFVRNPYDRCVSKFFFSKGGHKKDISIPAWVNIEPKIDFSPKAFSEFLIRLSNNSLKAHDMLQSHFILDENQNSLVDFIGKYENLKEDLAKILDILKINKSINELPHRYKNLIPYDKSEYLTPKNKQLIYDKFKKDFEIFGYEK